MLLSKASISDALNTTGIYPSFIVSSYSFSYLLSWSVNLTEEENKDQQENNVTTTTVLGVNNQRRGKYLVDNSEVGRYDINNWGLVFNSSGINGYPNASIRNKESKAKEAWMSALVLFHQTVTETMPRLGFRQYSL